MSSADDMMERVLPLVYAQAAAATVFLLSEEEEIEFIFRRRHRFWMRRWLSYREKEEHTNTFYKLQQELLQLGDVDEFCSTLRMPPAIYEQLLERVRPYIEKKNTNFRKAISAEERLSMTLRYLALGDCYRTLRQGYRVGLNTVGRVIRETSAGIYEALHDEYLTTPSTPAEWLQIAAQFQQKWNFPHVIGALDGKHVRIACPPGSGSYFFNYKLYYSVVLMAIVNAQYEFIYVDVGGEGKASDGGVWKRTSFFQRMVHPENLLGIPEPSSVEGMNFELPFFLVSDDAFALSSQVMKPFPQRGASLMERIFNYRLYRSRMVVEDSFGILATRFRIYRREFEMRPEGVEKCVMATIVLHNMLRRECGKSYMPLSSIDHEEPDHSITRGLWRRESPLDDLQPTQVRNHPRYARMLREGMCAYFLQKEGEVHWQYSKV